MARQDRFAAQVGRCPLAEWEPKLATQLDHCQTLAEWHGVIELRVDHDFAGSVRGALKRGPEKDPLRNVIVPCWLDSARR